MAGYKLPSISVNVNKEEDSKVFLIAEESVTKYCVPVVSNTILIKNCQAKVLGEPFTPWSELSHETFLDAIMYRDGTPVKMAQTDVCEGSLNRKESEMIDLDYFYNSDSSSEAEESAPDDAGEDSSPLIITLRLLEELSYKILGEKTSTVPKIEKVVLSSDSWEEEDKSEGKTAVEEESEDEKTSKYVQYLDYVRFSEMFVDSILQSAKDVCKSQHDKKVVSVTFAETQQLYNIAWPTIERFNVAEGAEAIDKYIQRAFFLVEAWKYKITHLISQSDKMSDFYFYEVKFCIPTTSYPIAQATVSVYFTIEVSRVVPKQTPVTVTFTLESLRRVMVPGDIMVNDEMLLRVLYSKLAVFKGLFF